MNAHGIFYFMDIQFICYNGKMVLKDQAVLTSDNRSFKYGDGVFETMKWKGDRIVLGHYHFERLFTSLTLIQINAQSISTDVLIKAIAELCSLNNCIELARVRLTVYRGESNKAEYLIEATPIETNIADWNEKGLTIDLHPYVRKNRDVFANLKTANYLPYVMAELYREQRGLDECLVLNTCNNICDGAKSNIFLLMDKEIYTPALHQGCINGVLRRFIIDELKKNKYTIKQTTVSVEMLQQANEVILTNAIRGVKWVEVF
ncbi:MAG: aminotransferase class IV, partial [Bacteroidota bacterium]|nr:aminotransferase class IV [Bacteroidota bacterium]